jgi:hypothetical protein
MKPLAKWNEDVTHGKPDHAVDGGAALIILISAILAFSRGLVRELMAILGWIGAAIAAYYFAPGCSPWSRNCPWWANSCRTAANCRWSPPLPGSSSSA